MSYFTTGASNTIPRSYADPSRIKYEYDPDYPELELMGTTSIGTEKFLDERGVSDSKVYDDERFFIISFHGAFSSFSDFPCDSVFDRNIVNDNVYYITSCDDQCSALSYQYEYHTFLQSYFSGEKGRGSKSWQKNGASRLKDLYAPGKLEEFSRRFIDGHVGSSNYQVAIDDRDICHLKLSRRTIENDWYFSLTQPMEGMKGLYEVRNGYPIKLLLDMYDDNHPTSAGEFRGHRNFESITTFEENGAYYYKDSICLSEIIDKLKEEYIGKKLYIYITSCSSDPRLKVSGSGARGSVIGTRAFPRPRQSFCHECMKAIGFAGGNKLKKSKRKTKRKTKKKRSKRNKRR